MSKKILAGILAAVMVICFAGCANKEEASAEQESVAEEESGVEEETGAVAGGWTIYEDETKADIPEDAQKAFDKAMEGMTGVGYTPVALLGTQVVSGTNYAFLCRSTTVTAEPVTTLSVVIVYEDLEGNAEVTNISDFDLAALSEVKESENTKAEATDGGWTQYTEQNAINLPADAADAFDKAAGEMKGGTMEPLALLGTQVVSGTNYAILTKSTADGEAPELVVTFIYADLEGNAEATNIARINIADYTE